MAVQGRRLTDFYGDGLSEMAARFRLSPETARKLADTYETKPLPRRLRAVPAPPALGFEDLSPELQEYVRRACEERHIALSRVEIISLREVVVP